MKPRRTFLGRPRRLWPQDKKGRWTPKVAKPEPPRPLAELDEEIGSPRSFECCHSPEHRLAMAVIVQAVEDLRGLRAHGLITATGECRPWPKRRYVDWTGQPRTRTSPVLNMSEDDSHAKLVAWFQDGGCQAWLDAINSRLSAAEVFRRALRKEAA